MTTRTGGRTRRASARWGSGRSASACSNSYGLDRAELRAELRRLSARGWQLWELRVRFPDFSRDRA
ncbi:hypothetical protein ACH40F_29140 [Streptomyces sp. NPDC020794]|uniref:hypothetical protein n=1 Tax=unclassified Streptomyces TaxID=2593676 RepID=UPI0036EC53D7